VDVETVTAPDIRKTSAILRVLYLNPFSREVSGPDESLLALLSGLIPLGIEPHIVLPRPGPQVSRYEALGARVHYAPLTFLKRRLGLTDVLLFLPRLVRGVVAVSRIARRQRVALIHTNMEVVLDGALAALVLRLPHVLHYRGNTLDRPRLVFDMLTHFWTATSRRVICISNATADIFRKRGLGARVEVVYNPVDVEAFASARRLDTVRAEFGARPGDTLIGTVCRIHPRKDIATFLRACALASRDAPRLRCVVVGAAEVPEERDYLEQMKVLASSLGIEVCWAGARRDMSHVLKALDIFVLASRNEGFGRVVAEASAAGIPILLSREGAFPELAFGNHQAILVEAGSAPAFAGAIQHLMSTGAQDDGGDRGIARFEVGNICALVKRVYEDAAGDSCS
jgi:glycosyltransferase involved in cell wall biosynthesis